MSALTLPGSVKTIQSKPNGNQLYLSALKKDVIFSQRFLMTSKAEKYWSKLAHQGRVDGVVGGEGRSTRLEVAGVVPGGKGVPLALRVGLAEWLAGVAVRGLNGGNVIARHVLVFIESPAPLEQTE